MMSRFAIPPVLVVILCVFGILAQSHTHAPKPTREPNENESVMFTYSGHTHHLYLKVREMRNVNCYIVNLSDAERMDVHSDTGMRSIELKYLGMIAGAQPMDVASVSQDDHKACGHAAKNGTVRYFML